MGLEDSLRDNQRRDELLQGAAVGTWRCDAPFDRMALDPQSTAHFHLGPESSVTMSVFYDRVHPEDRARVEAAIESCIAARLPLDSEYRMVSPDGARVTWVRAVGRASYDATGKPVRFDGVSLDVTPRKGMEAERELALEAERAARAEAERQSHLKDEFLATLSHELRTPLNAILGWAQILSGRGVDAEGLAEGLATIERNARVQSQMIEDLLDLNRVLSGRVRRFEPLQQQLVLSDLEDRHHVGAAGYVGQPAEPRGLPGVVPERRVGSGLPEGLSRHTSERSSRDDGPGDEDI